VAGAVGLPVPVFCFAFCGDFCLAPVWGLAFLAEGARGADDEGEDGEPPPGRALAPPLPAAVPGLPARCLDGLGEALYGEDAAGLAPPAPVAPLPRTEFVDDPP